MKRYLAFLFALVLLASAAAYAEQTFTVTPNPPEGNNYSYKYAAIIFKANASTAIMDRYPFALSAVPQETEGDLYVALDDLKAMHAPDFKVTADGGKYTVEHVGLTTVLNADSAEATVDSNAYTFKNAPKLENGVLMVPVLETMKVCFAKATAVFSDPTGDFYAIAYANGTEIDRNLGRDLDVLNDWVSGEKKYGFVYLTYTIPDDPDQKVLPLRLYIPTSYNPDVPNKAIMMLHGSSQNMNFFYPDTNANIKYYRAIEDYAEELGYILISGTAYVTSGTFGNVYGYPVASNNTMREPNEKTKAIRLLSEKSAMVGLDLVKSLYNIDSERLYLMGNSMGGLGCFLLANKYPEVFRAIAPSGATFNFRLFNENPLPNLVDKPILLIYGTEDEHSFMAGYESYNKFMPWVNDAHYYWVGGGKHGTAWAQALDKIFDFFEAHQ